MSEEKNKKTYRLMRAMNDIDDELLEMSPKKKGMGRKKAVILLSVAAAIILSLSLWLFLPLKPAPITEYKGNEYYSIIQKIYEFKSSNATYKNNFERLMDSFGAKAEDMATNDMVAGGDAMLESSNNAAPNSPNYVETTDNQVAGVTEADRIKRSDKNIFYLDGDKLRIFNIEKENTAQLTSYDIDGENDLSGIFLREFYLSEDCERITVIGTYWDKEYNRTNTTLFLIDVRQPHSPSEIQRIDVSGDYLSSRYVDGRLMLFTNFYLISRIDFDDEKNFVPFVIKDGDTELIAPDDIVSPDELSSLAYTVVCLFDEETLDISDSAAFLSYSSSVYVSENNLYASRPYTEETKDGKTIIRDAKTDVSVMSYKGGSLEHLGTATVDGSTKDQYSFDEKNGILRVVTTTETRSYTKYGNRSQIASDMRNTTNASLYCIDLDSFDVVASVENFAPDGESVMSVRFDGDKAYVCTAIVFTDPVFFFDLSDISNITYIKTDDIDGFSSSLIDLGEGLLLGIGRGSTSDLKLEVYRQEGKKVVSVCKYEMNNLYFSSDYKSYFIDRNRNIFGLGLTNYYNGTRSNSEQYILFKYENGKIEPELIVSLSGSPGNKRAVLIDEYFYMFGENDLQIKKLP